MKWTSAFALLIIFWVLSGCYSFRPSKADPNLNTYFVYRFEDNSLASPPDLPALFTVRLQDKIRNQSRLTQDEFNPDVEFRGTITRYIVTSEAPEPGERTAINRLTIAVNIQYINHIAEEQDFDRTFSFFFDFDSAVQLVDVQEEAHETILAQINEDIFNAAFNNW